MITREEILEYPYNGTITRTIAGKGMQPDTEITVYEGVMDEHMATDEEGRVMQTSSYIISIPLTQDEEGNWIVPRKGDKISLARYGETFNLTVDNADPSQLGGVSIYATRSSW
jgi:hypothetical protein